MHNCLLEMRGYPDTLCMNIFRDYNPFMGPINQLPPGCVRNAQLNDSVTLVTLYD